MIYLATDHAGYALKEKVKHLLLEKGFSIEDCGAHTYNPEDDYPDLISIAAKKVGEEENSSGIIFGKSGTGEAIVANKIAGVRAVVGLSEKHIRLAREHNDVNILSLGSDFINDNEIDSFITTFLDTPFSQDERHRRRIEKIHLLEK